MKKMILSSLFVGLLSMQGFSHVDLYGIYVRLSPQSFYCAMISKAFCARVSCPDTDDDTDEHPWKGQFFCYYPDGTLAEEFTAQSFTIIENPLLGTIVEYIP